jgi:catechol 2,3-dioxygenase-like lactoylglutathione lyase family enzyme
VVPDLDRAREFYEQMFGFRYFCDEGWADSDIADRAVGIKGSACRGVTLAGHNCYLELFEFARPEAQSEPHKQPNDPGLRHLCFHVDDCEAEYRRLLSLGGLPLGEVTDIGDGVHVVYCRDPFGNIIELAEVADGADDLHKLPGIRSYAQGAN